jgi:hypothetical protein
VRWGSTQTPFGLFLTWIAPPLVAKGSLKGLREGGCGCVDSSDTRVLQCRICRGRVVVNLWVNLTFGWWFLSLRSSLLGWGIENMFLFFFLFFINCIKVACYYIFFFKKMTSKYLHTLQRRENMIHF